jgi:hypothetical protein
VGTIGNSPKLRLQDFFGCFTEIHGSRRVCLREILWLQMFAAKEGAMIKKVAGGYKVLSEKGKNLGGPYKTKAEAEKRLRQVEYFKHNK